MGVREQSPPPASLEALLGREEMEQDAGPLIDEEALARAEQALAALTDDYVIWASRDLTTLTALLSEMDAQPERWDILLPEIFRTAHDIKGQGGSFGFDLMTRIGNQLCRFIEQIQAQPSQAQRDAMRLHADSMRAVISERLTGDGGARGGDLVAAVDRALSEL